MASFLIFAVEYLSGYVFVKNARHFGLASVIILNNLVDMDILIVYFIPLFIFMDRSTCENLLDAQYQKNATLGDNISRLTSLSRGKDKAACLQQMGGVSEVKSFLFTKSQYEKNHTSTSVPVTGQKTPVMQTSTGNNQSDLN